MLPENFFRHEYSRLVSMLTCRVGIEHIADVEDAVQTALTRGYEAWLHESPPDRPSAWLYRVALNLLLDELRRSSRQQRLIAKHLHELSPDSESTAPSLDENAIRDDQLRMLFVCCEDDINLHAQLVFTLKILCGFTVKEIAKRLFVSEANVYKRYARARDRLRQHAVLHDDLADEQYKTRLSSVHKILYVLFTEGHLSNHESLAIRMELCDDAIRMATMLTTHAIGQHPETYALLALMHFHRARLPARLDNAGSLLLLEEQDRSLWNRRHIGRGMTWLNQSAQGDSPSRYHAEAAVAAEHCLAPSLAETRWDRVVQAYELLERLAPSPMNQLNRAVAVAEQCNPEAGLHVLDTHPPPAWLGDSFQWNAVRADLHRRCGHTEEASRYRAKALRQAASPAIRDALLRRLATDRP